MVKHVIVTLGALLALSGCVPPTGPGTGGGSGSTGGGAGSTGGGSGSTGGGSGSTGGGSGSTFTLSGTATAPSGVNVQGSFAIACAWINDTCDENKSLYAEITGSGQSAPFTIDSLETGLTYFLVLWKDVNGTQDIDDGDYFGVSTNEDGNILAYTETTSAATVTMTLRAPTPQPTAIPPQLVGGWTVYRATSEYGIVNTWTFRSDGTVNNTYSLVYPSCASRHTTTEVEGTVAISGADMTFNPATALRTEQQCNAAPMTATALTNVRNFTWRVGTQTAGDGGVALFLKEDTATAEAEFAKD